MEKEIFINNVLNSANGVTKVIPNEQLYKKIQSKLEERKPVDIYSKWMVAASIIILFTLNIIVISNSNEEAVVQDESMTELVSGNNNQLYLNYE